MKKLLTPFFVAISIISAFSQELCLQLHSVEKELRRDVPGTLKLVHSWGIRYVEAGSTYGMNKLDFVRTLKENDLTVVSVGAGYNQLKDSLDVVINNARFYGAKYVVCFWIPHQGDEFTIEDMKQAVSVFSDAGKKLKKAGLNLCYHAHGYEFRPYEAGTLFDYLVAHTDPKYFNFEMDVFWVKQGGAEPIDLLKKYPRRFLLMHLKDRKPGTVGNKNGKGDPETNVVLGDGDVKIREIVKVLPKTGVKYYFIEDESSISVSQIPKSIAFLKNFQ